MSALVWGAAVWLLLVGLWGIVRSRSLVHTVLCLSVAQSSTYLVLLGVGYREGAGAPILSGGRMVPAVDPVVQALTLTDIVVGAAVTALLLSVAVEVRKHAGSMDPDQLVSLD